MTVKDREAWHAAVHGVERVRHDLAIGILVLLFVPIKADHIKLLWSVGSVIKKLESY